MVPASPISGIICDHYPVPLITARQYVCVSEKDSEKDRGKEVFCEKEWVRTVYTARVWLWHQKERALRMKNAYALLCVHTADPLCCSIHPVISNYREPQVFATASPRLLDLICSTPSVNQPLTHWFMVRLDLLSSMWYWAAAERHCREWLHVSEGCISI